MMGQACIDGRYTSRIGEKIGDLTFKGVSPERGDNNRLLGLFECKCGNTVSCHLGRVLNGKARSHCGCKTDHGANRTHGMRNSPEYSSWRAMKARCLDPDNKDYLRWGGSGITVCADWVASFQAFFDHVGKRPAGTTLDRIDTTRGYEPGNVKWSTPTEQSENRRDTWAVEIAGIEYASAEDAARAHGVSSTTINRWCNGFQDRRRAHHSNAGFTPAKPGCRMWRKYAH